MKKKILFVINTLSRAGAETALLELLAQLAAERGEDGQPRYELSLFVLMNQGELVQQIPEGVRLVNPRYAQVSVLEPKGRIYMGMTVVKCLLHRANLIRLWRYHWRAARAMRKEGRLMPDKLLWRAISDGARRFPEGGQRHDPPPGVIIRRPGMEGKPVEIRGIGALGRAHAGIKAVGVEVAALRAGVVEYTV